jgi:hypothetical protein
MRHTEQAGTAYSNISLLRLNKPVAVANYCVVVGVELDPDVETFGIWPR